MRAAVTSPETHVRVYRAVPPEHLEINRGGWATLSREYAHTHGYVDGTDDWPVVFADVPAKDVWTDGNDPSEYGYDGPSLTELQPYAEGEQMPPPGRPSSEARSIEHESVGFTPSAGAAAERRVPPSMSTSPTRLAGPLLHASSLPCLQARGHLCRSGLHVSSPQCELAPTPSPRSS